MTGTRIIARIMAVITVLVLATACGSNDGDVGSKTLAVGEARAGLCPPGFLQCGGRCNDPANDVKHCGSCNVACAAGDVCLHGACLATGAPGDPPTFTTPVEIDGAGAGSNYRVAFEGHPQSSWNTGDLYMPFQFSVGGSSDVYNYTTSSVWHSPWSTIPAAAGYWSNGDSWTASSGFSGLEYMSQIGVQNSPIGTCIGIGATTVANFGGTWNYPLRCATAPFNCTGCVPDGPSISYDAGGTTLWAVSTEHTTGGTNYVLHFWPYCQTSPGYSGCAEGAGSPVTVAPGGGHATVAVNPSTHNAVVAYRDTSFGGGIWLLIYTPNGTLVNWSELESSRPWGANSACINSGCANGGQVAKCSSICGTDCGTQGCIRLANKVQVATKYRRADGDSYAYVTFDALTGNPSHMRAYLDIVRITNDVIQLWSQYSSSGYDGSADDDYGSIAASNTFTDGAAWFYYHQANGDPCNTVFETRTSTNSGVITFSSPTVLTAGFPTMRHYLNGSNLDGMGHYIAVDQRGIGGGPIPVAWSQSVVTTSTSAPTCQGSTHYSLAIYGSQVTP